MKMGLGNRAVLVCVLLVAATNSQTSSAAIGKAQTNIECSTTAGEDGTRLTLGAKSLAGPFSLSQCAESSCQEVGLFSVTSNLTLPDRSKQLVLTSLSGSPAIASAQVTLTSRMTATLTPRTTSTAAPKTMTGSFQAASVRGEVSDIQELNCREVIAASASLNKSALHPLSAPKGFAQIGAATDGAAPGTTTDAGETTTEVPAPVPVALPAALQPSAKEDVICTELSSVAVYDTDSRKIKLVAKNGDAVKSLGTSKKQKIDGRSITMLAVEFLDSKTTGFVERDLVKERSRCVSTGTIVVVPTPKVTAPPAPTPTPVAPKAPPTPTPILTPIQKTTASAPEVSCAQKVILASAKKYELENYDNRPESGGTCAFGVNRELDSSRVGHITAGFGEGAVDFMHGLPAHGYVDTGIRDPNKAPPGSVIVFAGPNSSLYMKTGEQDGDSAGSWAGHVTIKGDDGYYYTDGRTKAPAVGWTTSGVNSAHVRNVIGIFIPGPALVSAYAGKCGK